MTGGTSTNKMIFVQAYNLSSVDRVRLKLKELKAKTIEKYLRDLGQFTVEASKGHIRDLPEKAEKKTVDGEAAQPVHVATGRELLLLPGLARVVAPKGARGRAYGDQSTIKSVLLMTDGEFNTSYLSQGQNSVDRTVLGSSPNQALELCNGMKARGITVWTVAFQASPAAEALLRDCASSTSNFFSAVDSAGLQAAFVQVARQLTALRLSQ